MSGFILRQGALKENWIERDDETAKAMVKEFMDKNDNWVIDGNYTNLLREQRLREADMIVFMRFSRLTCLRQAIKRYKHTRKDPESMADNCPENGYGVYQMDFT